MSRRTFRERLVFRLVVVVGGWLGGSLALLVLDALTRTCH